MAECCKSECAFPSLISLSSWEPGKVTHEMFRLRFLLSGCCALVATLPRVPSWLRNSGRSTGLKVVIVVHPCSRLHIFFVHYNNSYPGANQLELFKSSQSRLSASTAVTILQGQKVPNKLILLSTILGLTLYPNVCILEKNKIIQNTFIHLFESYYKHKSVSRKFCR